ncbi:secondary thiamine-phosphate synthase enzyme YjbQ [Candidatus Micrarchaeota archaeon]|nr:secondary thiamine-phosphate synthase enzyme YjbQ [Candidatus Micrarchaeota archaeon]
MKSSTEYLTFDTEQKIQFVMITDDVTKVVEDSRVKDGLVLVTPMHITAAVIVNDNEDGLHNDYLRVLEKLVPYNDKYEHNVAEDNAAAHIWRQFMGHQVVLPITNGKLDLGPWEQIFYCEFDGKRQKKVLVKVIGD